MDDIWDSLCDFIPPEIVFHEIIPYVPCFQLSDKVLQLQRNRVIMYSIIRKELSIECESLQRFLFSRYDGRSLFTYETPSIYLFVHIQPQTKKVLDYLYILS